MATQVTNYQCPACMAPLHFGETSGKLECDYCGSSFTAEQVEAFYAQKDQKAAEAFRQEEQKRADAAQAAEGDQESAAPDSEWGEDAQHMRAYNCPSCGAKLVCDDTTAATACPYCGNPTIVPGQFAGTRKPELIIPFKLDKQAAVAALKNHYKGKLLLPKEFRDENHIQEMKGVYVPFWLYDLRAVADCAYGATRTRIFSDGDYRVTETSHFAIRRSGSVDFAGIPADASEKMNDAYMDSIEPYDFDQMKPFSTAYLPGFLADRFDVSAEENAKRAQGRCRATALELMQRDVSGYDTLIPQQEQVHIRQERAKYVLLPVWTLHTKWNGKDYLFMMNGQTGKMVGDLPVCPKRHKMFFGAFAGGTLLLSMLLGIGGWLAELIWFLLA